MALKVSGSVLSYESEKFDYQSKKTGQKETMTRATLIVQSPDFGIFVGQAFNPKGDVSGFKVGAKVSGLEITEYKVDGGIQKAVFRL